MTWSITFTHTEWLDKHADGAALLIHYEKAPSEKVEQPEGASLASRGSIKVTVSRNVMRNWGLEGLSRPLEAQLVQHAWRFTCDQIRAGGLEASAILQLNSYNTSKQPEQLDLEKYYIPWAIECDGGQ